MWNEVGICVLRDSHFINITFRKRSNFFKDEVDAYFVNEGKICRVKPMKQNQ